MPMPSPTLPLRPFKTKDVQALGESLGVAMPHRDSLSRISDTYGWGVRHDSSRGQGRGPRAWSEPEARALVEVCRLRNLGLERELIDQIVQDGLAPVLAQVTDALSVIEGVQAAA